MFSEEFSWGGRASKVWRLTRLGKWISVFGRRRRLPQKKGCLKCSRFLLLPQKVTFIQRVKEKKKKKEKNDKMSIPWLPSLPPPAAPQPPPRFYPWLVLGSTTAPSDEVSNIEGPFLNGGVVEGLDVSKSPLVFFCHHVNSHTLTAEMSTTTDSVDIVFPIGGEVIVDD